MRVAVMQTSTLPKKGTVIPVAINISVFTLPDFSTVPTYVMYLSYLRFSKMPMFLAPDPNASAIPKIPIATTTT